MASGPKNYLAAQRLLDRVTRVYEVSGQEAPPSVLLAAAQAHATLALAAATALSGVSSGDWQEAVLRDKRTEATP